MHRKNGLTIIECLLSIIILAIMLTAGMAFYFNAQASMRWSIHKRIALEMASAEMESIKNSGYASLSDPAPAGVWRTSSVNIGNLTGQRRDVYLSDIDANGDHITDYKQVHIVVTWQNPGKSVPSSVSLDTYIAP